MFSIHHTKVILSLVALALGVVAIALFSNGVAGAQAQIGDEHEFTTGSSSDPGWFPAEPPAFPGPYIKPNHLPLGEWHVLGNGRIYILDITAVSVSGEVTADFSSGDISDVTWDASTRKLTFTRHVTPELSQRFTGYLLHYDNADPKWRMAGTFGDVNEVDPQSGWYATLPR